MSGHAKVALGIDQVEYRWRVNKDFTPIAASFDLAPEVVEWLVENLGVSVRPPQPNAAVGSPEISVAYLTVGEEAAFIWRHWDQNAAALQDKGARRPLVARVLLGPHKVLTPQVALALAWTGSSALRPPPGQVALDARLPAIKPDWLKHLVDRQRADLDAKACSEVGLGRLVAAALADCFSPLAIQLPAPELAGGRHAQLRLLWGLWRITAPILAGSDDGDHHRSWSFSTYEPPLEASQTKSLPDIVFRAQLPTLPPQLARTETTVALRSDEFDQLITEDFLRLGDALALAYEDWGSTKLDQEITDACKDEVTLSDRLAAVRRMLEARSSVAAPEPADAQPLSPPVVAETGWLGEEQTVIRQLPALDPARMPTQKPESAKPEPVAGDRSDDSRILTTELFHRLAEGPDAPGFALAIADLSHRPKPLCPEDRRSGRQLLIDHKWFIAQLAAYDESRIEQFLRAIFEITVIPDLSKESVREQIVGWAEPGGAPPGVMLALIAAADLVGDPKAAMLDEILAPAIYDRWRIEQAGWANRVLWPSAAHREGSASGPGVLAVLGLADADARLTTSLAFMCVLLIIALLVSLVT